MPINEKLERALVDYYNEYRPLFDNVPPYCSIPIPEATMVKDGKKEEEITFDAEDLRTESGSPAFMATRCVLPDYEGDDRLRCVIIVNSRFYNYSQDLNEDLFPLLHEMTHVKEGILYKNNLKLENEKLLEIVLKSKELHAELNPKNLNPDGEDFVLLLCFLAEVILNDKNKMRKNQIVGKRGIKHSDPIKCLVEQLYPDKYVAYLKIQNKKIT